MGLVRWYFLAFFSFLSETHRRKMRKKCREFIYFLCPDVGGCFVDDEKSGVFVVPVLSLAAAVKCLQAFFLPVNQWEAEPKQRREQKSRQFGDS